MPERLGLLFGLVITKATEYFMFDKLIFGNQNQTKPRQKNTEKVRLVLINTDFVGILDKQSPSHPHVRM